MRNLEAVKSNARIKKHFALIVLFMLMTVMAIYVGTSNAKADTAVTVKVGSKIFNGKFYSNKTSKALLKKLPVKYKMADLNGNEKYKYLSYELPVNEKPVKKIKAGDIMIYGSDCLVVFYKSFETSYEYTKIGRITNTKGLKKAAGSGKVTIKFSKKTRIALSKKKLTLKVGQKSTIKLNGAKKSKVKWKSKNKKIATVSKGKIKAKKAGTTKIIATYKKKQYVCKVTVKPKKSQKKKSQDKKSGNIIAQEKENNKENGKSETTKTETPKNEGESNSAETQVNKEEPTDTKTPANADTPADTETPTNNNTPTTDEETNDMPATTKTLTFKVNNQKIDINWEDNESVAKLKELAGSNPIEINMSKYGGFEQVGSIGTSLPRSDVRITTNPGDIVLYSGNQLVFFYGSNTWSYTKLGHAVGMSDAELKELLGGSDVVVRISVE